MRPNATRRDHWAQLGIGAVALLLPPLALGAALYSMLAPPDEEVKGTAATQTAVQPPAPLTAADVEPAALRPPASQDVEEVARAWNRLLAQGGSAQTAPAPTGSIQTGPVEIVPTPAAAVIPPADAATGGVTPPAADSPPVPPAPPKRTVRRQAPRQPQQDPYPVRTWLQQIGIQIGILPRNAKDAKDTRG
jgi:hypothetical protein